nr:cell filamentation protein Fic [Steroidobacteraceae bacterium]
MATTPSKLAQSLTALKELQDAGVVAIRSGQLTRTDRERLLRNGFIREVMKGWYVAAAPDEAVGESTAWYASFWGFVAGYLSHRFGQDWCLSPEQSLRLQVGDWTVPAQLLIRSPRGGNKPTPLLHGTSLFDARLALPPAGDLEIKDGLRLWRLPAALIACAPGQFASQPTVARSALAMLTDASELLGRLLAGSHSVVAGRLAGALRNIGRDVIADDVVKTMRAADF